MAKRTRLQTDTRLAPDLGLPQEICLYLQNSSRGQQRKSFFVQPETNMNGMYSQTGLKHLTYDGKIFPILQSTAEPGVGFGMFIYTSKAGALPHPCETSGSDIFKQFLFNALNTHPDFGLLDVTDPTELEFQFIIMSTGPNFPSFTRDNFNNGGENFRLYGSVLMTGYEVDKKIENDKYFGNKIFIVSNDGSMPLAKKTRTVGGRKKKTRKHRKAKKSKKAKKTRKSKSRSKVRN